MANDNILIVEDNAINLRLAKVTLAKRGFNVVTAQDAEEALNILKDYRPDLILMDLQLPGMDGFQLTTFLKKNPETAKIIIVALTAYAMRSDEDRAYTAGCDGYISKPFDVHELPEQINYYLKK